MSVVGGGWNVVADTVMECAPRVFEVLCSVYPATEVEHLLRLFDRYPGIAIVSEVVRYIVQEKGRVRPTSGYARKIQMSWSLW